MTKEEWKQIREQLEEVSPEIVLFDGLEDAFLGVCRRFNQEPIAIYDYYRCIEIRMKDGGTYEDASEFHEFNTMGAWVGDHTPAFLVTLDQEPLSQVKAERPRILERAKTIRKAMGSRLHNPGQMIDLLIRELENEENTAPTVPFQAKTLVAFTTDSEKREYPVGTQVSVIEGLPLDAKDPEAYIVEVTIPDATLIGGFRFDTAELKIADIERVQ